MFFKSNKFQNRKTKILMLNAPSFNMFMNFPYLALPLLIGQLRGAGYEVYTKDFTVCFFQNIANKRYIKKIYNLIKDIKKKI